MKLAQRYGVPYEEIMGWFCQHYGFGEIDLAYSLSRQIGQTGGRNLCHARFRHGLGQYQESRAWQR